MTQEYVDPELRQVLYTPKIPGIPLLWEKQKGLLAKRFVAFDSPRYLRRGAEPDSKTACVAELLVDIATIGDT